MTALFGGRPGVGGAPGARRATSTALAVLVLVGRDEMVGGPAEQRHPPERALSTGVNVCQPVWTIICVHRYGHVWTRTTRTRAPSQSIHRTLNPEDPEPESPEEAGRLAKRILSYADLEARTWPMPNLEQEIGAIYCATRTSPAPRGSLAWPPVSPTSPTWSTRMWTCCCRKATGWRQCAHLHDRPGADWPRGRRLTGRHSAAGVFRMRYRVQDAAGAAVAAGAPWVVLSPRLPDRPEGSAAD